MPCHSSSKLGCCRQDPTTQTLWQQGWTTGGKLICRDVDTVPDDVMAQRAEDIRLYSTDASTYMCLCQMMAYSDEQWDYILHKDAKWTTPQEERKELMQPRKHWWFTVGYAQTAIPQLRWWREEEERTVCGWTEFMKCMRCIRQTMIACGSSWLFHVTNCNLHEGPWCISVVAPVRCVTSSTMLFSKMSWKSQHIEEVVLCQWAWRRTRKMMENCQMVFGQWCILHYSSQQKYNSKKKYEQNAKLGHYHLWGCNFFSCSMQAFRGNWLMLPCLRSSQPLMCILVAQEDERVVREKSKNWQLSVSVG
jgi:hypothetical protein